MTTTTEPGSAVTAADKPGPYALAKSYSGDFTSVMPSHVKPEAWLRIALGALKKGKRTENGQTELEIAATNNPGAFLAALLDAARLGLEPGTEQFYLTPRKVSGRLEILPIVGYQGIIELMYRAGAVSSVVAEVVYDRDEFTYQPGRDEVPQHVIDWDSDNRGDLRLVYAYARMRDGAVSKVVVLGRAAIETIKKSSQGANSQYSPWVVHPASMWLKSAVRQLAKWVPTSAEYVLLDRPKDPPATVRASLSEPLRAELPEGTVDRSTGEIIDSEVAHDTDEVDAVVVEDPVERDWNTVPIPGGA